MSVDLVGSGREADVASENDAVLNSDEKKHKPTRQRPVHLSKAKTTVDLVGSESKAEVGNSDDEVDAERGAVDTVDKDYKESIKKKQSSRQRGPTCHTRRADMASKTKRNRNDHTNAIDDKDPKIAAGQQLARASKQHRRTQRKSSENPDENGDDSNNHKRLTSQSRPTETRRQQLDAEGCIEAVEESPRMSATPGSPTGIQQRGSSPQTSGRRRRKTPQKKSPARRNEVNLIDDEFTFLG